MPSTLTTQETHLQVSGMTCGSCAGRVTRSLEKIPGTTADVNYATGRARVSHPRVDVTRLLRAVKDAGYEGHLPEEVLPEESTGKVRLVTNGVLFLVVLLVTMAPALQLPGWAWTMLGLTSVVVAWGGYEFHKGMVLALRHKSANMNTLVSVGTLAALLQSAYTILNGGGYAMSMGGGSHVYLEVAAGVTFFLLLGRHLERRARRQAGAALEALLSGDQKDAVVLANGKEKTMPVLLLQEGDHVVVRPGQQVPCDGEVVEGGGALDTSSLTGESVPQEVRPGQEVLSGSINREGHLVVLAKRVGRDTQLAQMAKIVMDAQDTKAKVEKMTDRASRIMVPLVILVAVLTVVTWMLVTGDWEKALTAGVAVLIIACPCALGLATPMAMLNGTSRAAELGVLIRGADTLEASGKVDTVVFDKTGTLTTGTLHVKDVHTLGDTDEETLLRLAGALEKNSEHPVGRALARDGKTQVTNFKNTPGLGVQGTVLGHDVRVGQHAHMGDWAGAELPTVQEDDTSVAWVGWDEEVRGYVRLTDTVRAESKDTVLALQKMGMRVVLLTGDSGGAARAVAEQVGIKEVYSQVLPTQKARQVALLQDQGRYVMMVGDGVNDAGALAQADLGVSVGAGSDLAHEASDLTLTRDGIKDTVLALRLARRTMSAIKENLFWASIYNIIFIPVAALGLLNPLIAGGLMAISSLMVVGNSLRLRRIKGALVVTSRSSR